jgi:hypothetical protein
LDGGSSAGTGADPGVAARRLRRQVHDVHVQSGQDKERRDGHRYRHHRQRAAGRMNPDDGTRLPERMPDPVREQGSGQLGDWQPRRDAHPALLTHPAQRGTALLWRKPRQQVHEGVTAVPLHPAV